MKYIVITFITILTFVVPVNVNAQDNEDITFEFLFQALDSLEISQQRNVQAERIVRQARQTNDSLRTEIEVLEQARIEILWHIFIACCSVFLIFQIWNKRKKK
jgi:uncharacterized membrane protein